MTNPKEDTMSRSKALRRAAIVAPLAIGAIAAPSAVAMPDRGPIPVVDAQHHALWTSHGDLRGEHAKDAARTATAPNPGPPTWPTHYDPITRPQPAAASKDDGGFDLAPEGILIASGILAAGCAVGVVRFRTRTPRPQATA
jgi:hypothetical protein